MKKQLLRYGILLMMMLCAITYANHFQNGFHFDDSHTIQNNAYIRNIGNIPLFFKDGSTSSTLPQNQSYRPVTTTSLAFDYWLGHDYYLFFFHLSTFLLFLAQGWLMVKFMARIFNITVNDDERNTTIALIAGTFYLLHPAIAETVNYVIARADIQSTFGVVMAFVLYQYSVRCRKYYLYLLPVIVGALAKPPSVMFAPMFLVYLLFFEEGLGLVDVFKPSKYKQVFRAILKSVPAFVVCGLMYLFIDKMTPKTWQPGGTSPIQYLITQPIVIAHYFQMFFVPTQLSADSDWTLLPSIHDWRFAAGMVFVLTMIVIAFITSQKKISRPISFGIVWFFLALLPTSSIIPLAEVLNDHRMFFPFVGLLVSVSWTVALLAQQCAPWVRQHMPNHKIVFTTILALLLATYAYGTWQRNEVWYDEDSLWHDVTIKSPNNGRGLMNYGLSKMAQGDYVTAEVYYQRARKLLPTYFSVYVNLGILKAATGHDEEAKNYFEQGVAYGSNYPDAYSYYGRFLNSRGQYGDAIPKLLTAISLSPANTFARAQLMEAYQNTGQWDKLKNMAQTTLQLEPDNTDTKSYLQAAISRKSNLDIEADAVKKSPAADKYLTLSLEYYNAGRFQDCINACNHALLLKPNFVPAYNNICASYNKLRQWDNAIAAAQKGLALEPNNQLLKNNLAEAERHGH
ncbi:tetratricopeptide repeat protein [Mucilaginibacter ximonensis]|uniref:Tetratricopeptide repeat protein n=1 Tax=Mucilaginibacter ximonensis TaxID=538021 RepID=A0ABW5YCV2_9SPHI